MSTQTGRQPRASRPGCIEEKCRHEVPSAFASVRRQPQTLQLTGPFGSGAGSQLLIVAYMGGPPARFTAPGDTFRRLTVSARSRTGSVPERCAFGRETVTWPHEFVPRPVRTRYASSRYPTARTASGVGAPIEIS